MTMRSLSLFALGAAVAATTVEIVNLTPDVQSGATIYDAQGKQSISVFGFTCPTSGCIVQPGATQSFDTSAGEFGVQWNVNRLAPDGKTCDQPCSMYSLNLGSCSVALRTSGTMCQASTTPSWSANIVGAMTSGKCRLQVTQPVIAGNPRRCSCAWGAYPCSCPGGKCQGTCPVGGGSCPNGGGGCTCYGTANETAAVTVAPPRSHINGLTESGSMNMPICGIATQGCPASGISKGCGGQASTGGIPPAVPLCYGYGFDGCSYNKGNLGPAAKQPNCQISSGQLFNLVDEPTGQYAQAARDWIAFADKHATSGSSFLELVRAGRVTSPGTTGNNDDMKRNLQTFFNTCNQATGGGCDNSGSQYYIGTISFHAFANTDSGHKSPFTGNVAWILNTAVPTLRSAFPGKKIAMTNFGVLGSGSTAADEVAFINTLFSQLASASAKVLDYAYYFAAKDYGGGANHNGLCEAGIAQALVTACSGSSPTPSPPTPSPPTPGSACSAHTDCKGLWGNCCPTDQGVMLACCNQGIVV